MSTEPQPIPGALAELHMKQLIRLMQEIAADLSAVRRDMEYLSQAYRRDSERAAQWCCNDGAEK